MIFHPPLESEFVNKLGDRSRPTRRGCTTSLAAGIPRDRTGGGSAGTPTPALLNSAGQPTHPTFQCATAHQIDYDSAHDCSVELLKVALGNHPVGGVAAVAAAPQFLVQEGLPVAC